MYIYELSIAMADKKLKFYSEEDELILAIKRSIEVANKSYSATRYHRRIEYIERIDEDRIHIQMTSPESINPVRCITNLSRAFLKDAYWIDNSYTDKKRARKAAEMIRNIVIEYVNGKSDIK